MQEPKANNNTATSVAEKKPSGQGALPGFFRRIFDLPADWYTRRDVGKNNYEMGVRQFKQGNLPDAIFRLRLATWLEPKHAPGWYWLGRSYLRDEQKDAAIKALKKADALQGGDEHTRYMLAVAMGKNAPSSLLPRHIPQDVITHYFNQVAATYDSQLAEQEDSEARQVAAAAKKAAQKGRIDHVVLDLGAGTGLCGMQLADITTRLTGVDVSAEMLKQAKARTSETGDPLYDALIEQEAMEFLQQAEADEYDIVTASGLLHYIGETGPLFAAIARVLKPDGVFVASAMTEAGKGSYFVAERELFMHASEDLAASAAEAGLQVKTIDAAEFAPGQQGLVGVFSKA